MAIDNTATSRNMCKHPGCTEPAAKAAGPGRPPEYCEGRGHTKVTAWRERRRPAAGEAGATARPGRAAPRNTAKDAGTPRSQHGGSAAAWPPERLAPRPARPVLVTQ